MNTETPAFDPALAQPVTPYRHEPTARTVAFHQPSSGSSWDLFSATGLFIATESSVSS